MRVPFGWRERDQGLLKAALAANELRWEREERERQQVEEAAREAQDRKAEHYFRRRYSRARETHEPYTRQEVYDRDSGRCYMCHEQLAPGWHIEHVIPLARGGMDTPGNVRASCSRCNRRKGLQAPVFRSRRI
jgi:5-methylcytosine-specific restriction endonuclease McrA